MIYCNITSDQNTVWMTRLIKNLKAPKSDSFHPTSKKYKMFWNIVDHFCPYRVNFLTPHKAVTLLSLQHEQDGVGLKTQLFL
jgi:hypothetical protein